MQSTPDTGTLCSLLASHRLGPHGRTRELRVERARARSESLADSCKETLQSLPDAHDTEAPSTPGRSLLHHLRILEVSAEDTIRTYTLRAVGFPGERQAAQNTARSNRAHPGYCACSSAVPSDTTQWLGRALARCVDGTGLRAVAEWPVPVGRRCPCDEA